MQSSQARRARPQDAPAVTRLLASLGYPSDPSEIARRLQALGDGDCVLLTDGGLIALHRITRVAEGTPLAAITALVVAPDRREQGLGRALLAAGAEIARDWGCEQLEVSCAMREERRAAHQFYLACGFEEMAKFSKYYRRSLLSPESPGSGSSSRH